MESLKLFYEDALIPKDRILKKAEELKPEIENVKKALSRGYEDDRGSVNLPDDEELLSDVKNLIEDKLSLKPEYLIIVGIGGSNLGTLAVQEAVLGKLYNLLAPPVRVLYADTVDSDLLNNIMTVSYTHLTLPTKA